MVRALLLLLLLAACGGEGRPSQLHAGAATALLPIPVGHSHAGYLQSDAIGAPHPPDDPGSPFAELFPATRSLQSAPRAKAVVLAQGTRRLVLAQIDAIFVTAELTARVQQLARERLGTDLDGQLLLHASHTHGSAGRFSWTSLRPSMLAAEPPAHRAALAHGIDTFSAESTDRIAGAVVEAIGAALESLRPARFGWAAGVNETANRDRRCHDDWITGKGDRDTTLTVLRVDDAADGGPIAVLFHYALHGTFYDHDSRALSVDAPGHVEYEVERRFDRPVVAVFLQGAAASASPHGAGLSGSQGMVRVGRDLAASVLDLYEGIETAPSIDLRLVTRRVPLDAKRLGYRAGEFPADGAMLCHFLDASCRDGPRDPASLDCLGRAVEGGGKYETWVAAARLGDLAVLALPGEPSAAVGRALREGAAARGYAHAIPLGYSLDHDGYILFADDWLSGGSETNITFWGWRYADYVVGESLRALEALEGAPGSAGQAVRPAVEPRWDRLPVQPSGSAPAPGVVEEPPAAVERMSEIAFSFYGGDPVLGTPEVALERRAAEGWEPVRIRGWIPVTNLRGPELPTFYEAAPTWREAPEAAVRAHLWRVRYEPPRDLPEGDYRFVARGRAVVDGSEAAFELASAPFAVAPSTALRVEATRRGGRLEATLLYPERAPVWATEPRNDGWQIGGFRPVDPRFRPAFVPVLEGVAALHATAGGAPIALHFEQRPLDSTTMEYAPGEGPGFTASLPAGTGPVVIPAGALRDAWGNRNGAEVIVE